MVNFLSFIVSYLSLSVIAGLFTYRLINSLLENIILPCLDFTILPNCKIHKMNRHYNHKKEKINSNVNENEYTYSIQIGLVLKDFIIWLIAMLILYFIFKLTNKELK